MNCTSPTRIHAKIDGHDHVLYVPCGQCPACRRQKKFEWTIRLIHEAGYYNEKSFLTLTYADAFLPLDFGLHKRELQLFFKRLRKELSKSGRKFKYFACGEYGDRFHRPHYHAILFGVGYSSGDLQAVQRAWPFGFVYLRPVTMFRFQYVAGYVQKKLSKDFAQEVYGELQPPFQLNSVGLGERYCIDNAELLNERGFVQLWSGAKGGIPRYYKQKLLSSLGLLLQSGEPSGDFYKSWLRRFNIPFEDSEDIEELRRRFESKVLGQYEDDNGKVHYVSHNHLDAYVEINNKRRLSLERRTKNYIDNIRGKGNV